VKYFGYRNRALQKARFSRLGSRLAVLEKFGALACVRHATLFESAILAKTSACLFSTVFVISIVNDLLTNDRPRVYEGAVA
jgi:hypothetical protein